MANNDVLGNMFTSFVDGKKNTHISRSHYGSAFHRLPARGRNQSDIHFLLNPPLPPMQTEHVVHHVPRNNRSRPREYESNNHQQKILPSAHRQTPPNQSPEVLGSKLRHEKSNSRMSSSKRGVSGSASGIKKFHMKNGGNVVQSRGRATDSSVMPGRKSSESVEAIAVDSTVVPTPYHCEKCSKAFRQRSQLSRHFSRVHERRKPFACAHCDKCFASAFDRKRHVEVRYLCQLLFIVLRWLVTNTLLLYTGCAWKTLHRVLLR